MREGSGARAVFVALWSTLLLLKAALAARLPLFVDEAFYWQESRHLAWAYSDLPGLTAWLIRLGTAVFGDGTLALRMPFLLLASLVPWLVVRIAARDAGERAGWIAGTAALLLPLSGSLGLMALPDTVLVLATLLCLDAGTRLLRGVDYTSTLQLALGLALGALSHYRFVAVIGVGVLALLLLPQGRQALRDPRVWIAIAFGAAAWTPLLAWNLENAEAGLRFQLVDRHPWAWHLDGAWFVVVQALLATPLLFAALLWAGWRGARSGDAPVRFIALCGGLVVLGFFVLGFFADTERVSFHWPLPGLVALAALVPAVLAQWPRWLRALTWAGAGIGLAGVLGWYAFVSVPELRERTAAQKWYPSNFAGWDELADAVSEELEAAPPGTVLVADNFKIGAELGFALGDPRIRVLDHPLNRAHGRAPQLRLWGLEIADRQALGDRPALLVIGATDVKFSALVDRYQWICARMGDLSPHRVVNADRGARRFVLVRLPAGTAAEDGRALPGGDAGGGEGARAGGCVTPVVAHISAPVPGATVPGRFDVAGWAVKDGAGVESVSITLDGAPVARARYGIANTWIATFLRGRSRDPLHPRVAFEATVDVTDRLPGTYWLGLEITGRDGSVERWAEQPLVVAAAGEAGSQPAAGSGQGEPTPAEQR